MGSTVSGDGPEAFWAPGDGTGTEVGLVLLGGVTASGTGVSPDVGGLGAISRTPGQVSDSIQFIAGWLQRCESPRFRYEIAPPRSWENGYGSGN